MNKRFVIGIDRAKMRLHDLEESEQDGLVDSNQKEDTFSEPLFDKTEFGEGWEVWELIQKRGSMYQEKEMHRHLSSYVGVINSLV